jgi:riboflavin kinase/FMN adenylyltransferase
VKIYHRIADVPSLSNLCVTIGTFDGIHLGHKQILSALVDSAKAQNGESLVITFDPHPRIALQKEASQLRFITTLEEKIERLGKLDIDHLLVIPFTKDFSNYSAEDFIQKILIGKLNTQKVIVGYDHHFGKPNPDNPPIDVLLRRNHIEVQCVEQLILEGRAVSSTKIRIGIQEGRVAQAAQCLGYNYSIRANVEDGLKQGRQIGFPTANLRIDDIKKVIPKNGVYAVHVDFDGERYLGMMNIGYKPTMTDGIYSLEVHLLNFEGDLYQRELEVSFIKFIREEKKFESKEELIKQIQKDQQMVIDL